jgi:hypothetical protein
MVDADMADIVAAGGFSRCGELSVSGFGGSCFRKCSGRLKMPQATTMRLDERLALATLFSS